MNFDSIIKAQALSLPGARYWTKIAPGAAGPKIERVYLHIPTLVNLEVERYDTGNIRSAAVDGEPISNGRAYQLINAKAYVDLTASALVVDGSPYVVELVKNAITLNTKPRTKHDGGVNAMSQYTYMQTALREVIKDEIETAVYTLLVRNGTPDNAGLTAQSMLDMLTDGVVTPEELGRWFAVECRIRMRRMGIEPYDKMTESQIH